MEGMFGKGSVPVAVAARVYGKDPAWIRAGILHGWLPIGIATRDGEVVTKSLKGKRTNFYISPKRLYYISKHRYYELKHFCLQYYEWHNDPNGYRRLIHDICLMADSTIGEYIFKAVTEGVSYTYLKTKLDIPCGRSMYFDRYRKFFRLLSDAR